jgi:dipeptidyl aminopeptidase/acylaminoacyl peptidase
VLVKIARFSVAAWAVLGAFSVCQAQTPPLSAFGQLPALEDVEIAPTGDRIAYVQVAGAKRRLVIQSLTGGEPLVVEVGDAKVRDIDWAGAEHLLITTSRTDVLRGYSGVEEWSQVISLNLKTRKQALLLHRSQEKSAPVVAGDVVSGVYKGRPTAFVPAYTILDMQGARVDLYRVDLESGVGQVHAEGSEDTYGWLVRPDGEPAARTEYNGRRAEWRLLTRRPDGGWSTAQHLEVKIDRPSVVGLGRDGRSVALYTSDQDKGRIYELGGEPGAAPVPVGRDQIIRGIVVNPHDGRLVGLSYKGIATRYEFFEPALAAAWRKVRPAYPNQSVSLSSWTPDFSKLVVEVQGPGNPGAYHLVDLGTGKTVVVGRQYPDIPPALVAEPSVLTYSAGDGLELEGILTLPPGREPKRLPLVVLPHGGPAAHDEPLFDWWAQAIASRGYAVLQPNFRGSTGRGKAFEEAGHGQWGRKMQTDLSDGVRALAAQGIVDPGRVCIAGASYGGYAALAGATIDRGVYRCAISVNGVSDLPRMLSEVVIKGPGSRSSALRYWNRFMGAKGPGDPVLVQLSPARVAHHADIPVLLIHGQDDTVVAFEQSRVMAEALRRAGKPVELVTLPGEDHWLSRGETRVRMLQSLMGFLEKHNPPT